MIEELTSDQRKELSVYSDEWVNFAQSFKRINVSKALNAAKSVYFLSGQDVPKEHVVFPSPKAAKEALKDEIQITKDSFLLLNDDTVPFCAKLDYFINVLNVDVGEEAKKHINVFKDMARECFYVILLDEMIVLVDNPIAMLYKNGVVAGILWSDDNVNFDE